MKTLILATVAVASLAFAANAENFDNTATSLKLATGIYSLKVTGDQADGYTGVEAGANVLNYSIGDNVSSALDLSLGHAEVSDELALGAKYTVTYEPASPFSAYGSAQLEYVALVDDLGEGDFFVNPAVGASYVVADGLDVFGELATGYNVSEDWAAGDVTAELGANWYVVPAKVKVTPSVIYNVDTEDTEASVGATINF